jgi:16S rRNA (cytidine1402-2'-O)-methyltransferase
MAVDKNLQVGEAARMPREGPGSGNEGDAASVAMAAGREVTRQLGAPMSPGLYLVATPIGNLGDITVRGLAVLARADVIYCEDTRHSRTLLQHFAIRAPLKSYHEHNAAAQRPRIMEELAAGARVALITDAGTPLVSDPGYKLVREAVDHGYAVHSLPGASAVLCALASAGLPTDSFHFAGFLPPKSAARQARLAEIKRIDATLVFYEAPSRVAEALADLVAVLGERPGVIARELTKLHEELDRGRLTELAHRFSQQAARGEYVILVGPPESPDASDAAIEAALADALQDMRLKDAAKAVADALGVARGRVYDLGLKLKGEGRG